MTKKQFSHIILFGLLVLIMVVFLCSFLESENSSDFCSRFYTYTALEENTVDAVFIGTSGVDRYWVAAQAYDEYGMTVYPLSTEAMPSWLYTDILEYALEHHQPELVLVDTRAFLQDNESELMDIRARRVLDLFTLYSPEWFRAVFKTMDAIHSVDPERPRLDISFLFPSVRYHAKWETATRHIFTNSFGNYFDPYLGIYVGNGYCVNVEKQVPTLRDDVQEELDPLSLAAFYDFIALAREHELQLLFVDSPRFWDEHYMHRLNALEELIAQEGLDYMSWYDADSENTFSIALDPDVHFLDSGHVNFYGAQIFTADLAAYINDNYNLPDRRDEQSVRLHWEGVNTQLQAYMDYLKETFVPPEKPEADSQ